LDEGGDPNLLPSGERERDFGDSAGYGTGGSARDYREVVGEDPVDLPKPNPLDEIVKPKQGSWLADDLAGVARPGACGRMEARRKPARGPRIGLDPLLGCA
jgi:hypothetical protein